MNKDGADSVQFRVEPDEIERNSEEFLAMRRYDNVAVVSEARQASIGASGTIEFEKISFQATNTSVSLCILETGIIATITFSFEDTKVIDSIVKNRLRNQQVNLSFSEGKNPFAK